VGELTRRYLIAGQVQGVFFRQSARIEAQRLRLSGVARNLANGNVEVIARGNAAALDALRAWLERGPSQARVDAVREAADAEEPQIPEPGAFVVR
jgi:acylphosphatase